MAKVEFGPESLTIRSLLKQEIYYRNIDRVEIRALGQVPGPQPGARGFELMIVLNNGAEVLVKRKVYFAYRQESGELLNLKLEIDSHMSVVRKAPALPPDVAVEVEKNDEPPWFMKTPTDP